MLVQSFLYAITKNQKMKKLLLTIALAFATLASQAQTEWYGQVGLSLNKFSYSSEYEYGCDFKRNVGYEVMFGFLRPMGEKGLFLWGMNFGMGTRGSKSEWKDVLYEGCEIHFLENDESRFMFQYCPFELNSRIQIGSSPFAVNPHVGLYVSLDLSGKIEHKVDGVDAESKVFDDFDEYSPQRFDFGVNAGCRFWFAGKTFLDVTYKQGTIEPWDLNLEREGLAGLSNSLCFSVGYVF